MNISASKKQSKDLHQKTTIFFGKKICRCRPISYPLLPSLILSYPLLPFLTYCLTLELRSSNYKHAALPRKTWIPQVGNRHLGGASCS